MQPSWKDNSITIRSRISLIKDAFNHHLSGEATDLFIAGILHGDQDEGFPSVKDLCTRLDLPVGKHSIVWDHLDELASRELVEFSSPYERDMTDVISFPPGIVTIATATSLPREMPLLPKTRSYTFESIIPKGEKTPAKGGGKSAHDRNASMKGGNIPAIGGGTHHQHNLDAMANILRPIFEEECIIEFLAVYKFYLSEGRWPTVWELCDSLGVHANNATPLLLDIDLLNNYGLLSVSSSYWHGRSNWDDKVSYCDDVTLLVTGIIANCGTFAKTGAGC